MTPRHRWIAPAIAILLSVSASGAAGARRAQGDSAGPGAQAVFRREEPFVRRTFHAFDGERWIGNAIAYGPYRDGQRPGGAAPTKGEVREDLHLMSRQWTLLRLYGAVGPPETVLEVIREGRLGMKVMLGIWIAAEERRGADGRVAEAFPEARASNRREVEAAVRLAAAYPEIVVAVSVGNETQVTWSPHRVPGELLIGYLREVRARTAVPVTTVDDFSFWKSPESGAVAREVDFVVTHIHPLWNGQPLEAAMDWTRKVFEDVRAVHPDHDVVLGETGWATNVLHKGEQARLIRGRVGEDEQKIFYDAVTAWAKKDRIVAFFFEAFDENWKGGSDPDEVEKHWGLFRADRTPKKALAREP